jgi:hypothetical protein
MPVQTKHDALQQTFLHLDACFQFRYVHLNTSDRFIVMQSLAHEQCMDLYVPYGHCLALKNICKLCLNAANDLNPVPPTTGKPIRRIELFSAC